MSKEEDRAVTHEAAEHLSECLDLSGVVARCETTFQLQCVLSLIDQLIDTLTGQRARIEKAIVARETKQLDA